MTKAGSLVLCQPSELGLLRRIVVVRSANQTRSSWFAPRTKRYDRGAISDFLVTMNLNVKPHN